MPSINHRRKILNDSVVNDFVEILFEDSEKYISNTTVNSLKIESWRLCSVVSESIKLFSYLNESD